MRHTLPLILLALAALSTRPGRSIVLGVVFLARCLERLWRRGFWGGSGANTIDGH